MKIRVHGNPAPKGSVQTFAIKARGAYTGRVGLKSDNPALSSWTEAVRAAAVEARGEDCMPHTFGPGVPVVVELWFYMARPRGHYGSGRNSSTLRPSAPKWPMGGRRGDDLDKLIRAVGDALQAAAIVADDKQIVGYPGVWKVYADDQAPGAEITVTKAPEHPPVFRVIDPRPALQAAMAAAAATVRPEAAGEVTGAVLQIGGRRPGLYIDGKHVDDIVTSEVIL